MIGIGDRSMLYMYSRRHDEFVTRVHEIRKRKVSRTTKQNALATNEDDPFQKLGSPPPMETTEHLVILLLSF